MRMQKIRQEKIENKVPGVTVEVYPLEDSQKLYEKIRESDILVNATKSGMKPAEDESLIKDVSVFQPDFVVADAVYNQEKQTDSGGKSSRLQNCTGRNWYASMAGRSCFPDFYRREHATEEVYERFFRG